MMNIVILNYLYVVLLLALIFHIIPKNKMPINSPWLFIGIGLIIYFLYRDLYVSEGFDSSMEEEYSDIEQSCDQKVEKAEINSGQILSDADILRHVQMVVKNVKNHSKLNAIQSEMNNVSDNEVRVSLENIFRITILDPELIGRMALTAPQSILTLATMAFTVPELKDALNKVKASEKSSSTVQRLENKISDLEGMIKKLDLTDTVPEFLRKMMEQQKYVDRNGMIKDALYGDMKYNQLNPAQMQPDITREDDEWDVTGYTLVDPSKIRPPEPTYRDYYQEGECPVCPNLTSGYPVNVLEFDKARTVIGSDNISLDYIKKLNTKK